MSDHRSKQTGAKSDEVTHLASPSESEGGTEIHRFSPPPRAPAWKRLLAEFKRRHVFRVAAVYGAVGFAVIEAADAMFPHMALPGWAVTLVVWLVLLGFPLALVLAWAFETTPQGIRRTRSAEPTALDVIAAQPASRRLPIGLAGAAGGALVVAAAWLTLGDLRDAPANLGLAQPMSEAQTLATGADPGVAVVPFRAAGVDSTVWGTGIVELLSFNLDELEGLRKIDPRTVMAHWRELDASPGTPDSLLAHQVARATGARYAILGNAVRLSDTGDMRLTARVYDSEREEFRGAVRVDGPPDSVTQLIDRLTIEVLRGSLIPLDVEHPSVNLSRLTTASLPAMQAYLEGEQAYRRMYFHEAVPHYRTAVELDSTFARAYLRLGQAYRWRDLTSRDLAAAALGRAAELSGALPERDASLMKLAAGRLTQIPELETFTRAFPDDPDGWFMLADALFHAQNLDVPPERYRRAFERAVRVAPHYSEAYYHLVDDAVVHRDQERVAELAAAYDSLKDLGVGCVGLRILHDYLWGSPEARSTAVEAVGTVGFGEIGCLWIARAAMGPMMELSEQVQLHPDRVSPLALWRMMGTRLYNGWPTQAARVLSDAAENPAYRGFEAGNRIMMYLAGYADTLEAEQWKQTLRSHSMVGAERGNPAGPVVDYFWIAALALEQGRRDEFETALASMDSVARTSSQESGVRAEQLAAYADGLREFARLGDGQWSRLDDFEAALEKLVTISTIAEFPSHYMRFEVGKRLLDAGRPREAERYLVSIYPFALPYFVPAQFYLGRAYEELGERDAARERYRLFVEWWEDAEPHLRPWLDEADEALRRLAQDH